MVHEAQNGGSQEDIPLHMALATPCESSSNRAMTQARSRGRERHREHRVLCRAYSWGLCEWDLGDQWDHGSPKKNQDEVRTWIKQEGGWPNSGSNGMLWGLIGSGHRTFRPVACDRVHSRLLFFFAGGGGFQDGELGWLALGLLGYDFVSRRLKVQSARRTIWI